MVRFESRLRVSSGRHFVSFVVLKGCNKTNKQITVLGEGELGSDFDCRLGIVGHWVNLFYVLGQKLSF